MPLTSGSAPLVPTQKYASVGKRFPIKYPRPHCYKITPVYTCGRSVLDLDTISSSTRSLQGVPGPRCSPAQGVSRVCCLSSHCSCYEVSPKPLKTQNLITNLTFMFVRTRSFSIVVEIPDEEGISIDSVDIT